MVARPWYTLTAEDVAAIEQARLVLAARWAPIELAMQADSANDTAALRRLGPLLLPAIAAVDRVWPIIWPDTDPTTIAPGVRLAEFITYVAAANADQAQRLLVTFGAPPLVA